jgi:putative ABC transport system permease protein
MSRFRLILRNLRYFKGVNLALVIGMAVATAVLTGALMVGNSVQASLGDLARQRLGRVDDALIARRFFNQSLAERLAADPQLAKRYQIAPAVLLNGGAAKADESVRAGDVRVNAVGGDLAPVSPGGAVLNGPTAAALGGAKTGETVLLSLPDKPDEVREAALSRRSREDTLATMRVRVARVDSGSDMLALFDPNGGQRVPQNAWVNLAELQNQVDLQGRINAMLVHDNGNGSSRESVGPLNERLRAIVRLEDYGLALGPTGMKGQSALTSQQTYLDPPVVTAAEQVGRLANVPIQEVTVNLVNAVTVEPGGRQIHYAVAAGITPLDGKGLADDEVAINQWTAGQLGAKVGDRLHVTYYQRLSTGNLAEASSDATDFKNGFRVARILPMSGIGVDRSLTPNYKGLTDADTVADWNPPEGIVIDKKLVTKADEEYWKQYRAAPKLFLSFHAAERLWGGPLGDVTSIRIPSKQAKLFGQKLHDQLDPASMGLGFQPIKAQQLAAAGGSTDFGQYFLYFSFFIIVAAVLLVAMLFRLSVEQRARQLGLLSAVGFAPWTLRRISLAEGMLLAVIGALLGVPAAIGYTAFIMHGLRTWWNGAVGTTALYLHVAPMTLCYGYFASLAVAFVAIWWAVWRVGRTHTATLLAGGWGGRRPGRRSGIVSRGIGILLILLAIAIFFWARSARGDPTEAFLGGGTLLLTGFLFWLGGALRPGVRRSAGARGIATVRRLGVRNASRHTARSVLAVGLIAFAAFTLITVAAFRQAAPSNTGDPASGSGGYRLIATAGIPLLGDLNTPQGRRVLGMTDAADPLWHAVHFVSMRRWAGQDISCLNLTQPTTPTILSVPPDLMQGPDKGPKHRFTFAQGKGENPWLLLTAPQSDDTVPVIADANTAQYILKKEIGERIDVPSASGAPQHLKLVATLKDSVFQSELLMSESNFRRLFPGQEGFGVILVDTPAVKEAAVREALNTQLGEYAVDTEPTANRLARYFEIQNTYLSTFQALGALGLMLGTIGLAVVLVRTVIERKAELALLASLGFRRADRIVLVLSENVFLLVVGLLVGAISAVLGILPAIRQSAHGINFGALGATLVIVLLVGVVSSTIAVWISGAHVSPADLRHE